MRKILYFIMCLPILLLSACDVHEWPETPEFVKMHLRLNYETDMTEWEHLYDGTSVIEQGYGETYDNHRDYGKIRYIVRTYPVSEKMRTTSDYTQEFVFTKDISEGYDHEVTLDLLPGNYNVMVWSDLVQTSGDSHFHNTPRTKDGLMRESIKKTYWGIDQATVSFSYSFDLKKKGGKR